MNFRSKLRRQVNRGLHGLGYELISFRDSPSFATALKRVARRGAAIRSVIDIGASDGRWTAMARPFFPDARYLLVDANPIHAPALAEFARRHPATDVALVAAGDRQGEIYFDTGHAFIGIASHTPMHADDAVVPVTTVDALVAERRLEPPFLLKLDTHGFEVPILEGARQTLTRTDLLIVEVYNFRTSKTCLRFHELCAYLDKLGFRPIDLCEPLHRLSDDVLWQFDLIFAPETAFATERTVPDAYELFGMQRIPGQTEMPWLPRRRSPVEALGAVADAVRRAMG
jgi:FkbM family methyltransferase